MGQCQADHPDDPTQCEYLAASVLKSPGACKKASDPVGCIGAVAAELGDPQVILDNVTDPSAQATLLTAYVAATGDAKALDRIEDNNLFDLAVIYSAIRLGVGEDRRLPQSYCDRLRGGYYGDNAGDEDLNRDLCHGTINMSNWAVDQMNAAETEAEESRVLGAIETMVERIESGEVTLDDFLTER